MAGLEYIVRPAVFPDIRPTPNPSVAGKDDPNKGKAVITGMGGKSIDLPYSYSISASQSKPTEVKRRVDVARVYQMDDDGNVNKDNFVDIEVANKVTMRDNTSRASNIGAVVRDNTSRASNIGAAVVDVMRHFYYQRPQQSDNVEIKETNLIRDNPGQS